MFSNRFLLGAIAIALAFAAALIYMPALNSIFGTAPLTGAQLATVAPFPFIVWGADEIRRLILRRVRARRAADTARIKFEAQLRAAPDDYQQHQFLGLALAYLGQRTAAVREGERGLALALKTKDQFLSIGYARNVLARTYVAVGDRPHALDQLEALLAKPYFVSPAFLTIDPTWAPLASDPRFEHLVSPSTPPPKV